MICSQRGIREKDLHALTHTLCMHTHFCLSIELHAKYVHRNTNTHTHCCAGPALTNVTSSVCFSLISLSLSHTQLQWCMATLQYLSVSAFRYKYTKAWILKRTVGMTNSGSLVKGTLAPSPLFSGHVISLSKLMCCSKCLQRAIHQSDRPPTESTDSSQGGFGGISKHTQDCRKKCFNILQQKKKRKEKAHLKN